MRASVSGESVTVEQDRVKVVAMNFYKATGSCTGYKTCIIPTSCR